VFRHNPRVFDHPHAHQAAQAAEAAAVQGKFWEMHDQLFTHQRALDDASLVGYARALGLDVEAFEQSLRSQEHRERVHADELSGVRNHVISTPTIFINGRRYLDAPELEPLSLAIEAARQAEGGAALGVAELAHLRALLESKRRELSGHATRGLLLNDSRDERQPDPMDAASQETDEGEELTLGASERRLLEEIDHALAKMADQTYGISEESGEPIPYARLEAIPWARYSVEEEEQLEQARRSLGMRAGER
jgi:RNA polymerase-binding protein DksA